MYILGSWSYVGNGGINVYSSKTLLNEWTQGFNITNQFSKPYFAIFGCSTQDVWAFSGCHRGR